MPGNYYSRGTRSAQIGREECKERCACDPCAQKESHCDPCERKEHLEHCCDQRGSFNDSFAPAMAYVPIQEWQGIDAPCNGLQNGTVFVELVKPFCGAGRRKG